ncbi:MAG: copper amine oxidase N-terminal domain-containing protein [Armatimonadota bacterium]
MGARRAQAMVVAVALAWCLTSGASALAQNVQVTLDGARLALSEPVLIWETAFPLLPAEAFLQSLGATVAWDPAQQQLVAELAGVHLLMLVDRPWVSLNGQRETIEYGLQTLTGVPYVPGPAVARLLGFEATWDAATATLALTSSVAATAQSRMTATLLAPPGREVPVILTVRVSESGAIRDVPLDQGATISRGRRGQPQERATVDDLAPGDLLVVGLTRQGVGVSVEATYVQQIGTIASIQSNQLTLEGAGTYPLGEGVRAVGSDGGPLHVLGAVGEGAILRLNPETNAVWGIFSQRRGSPAPPQTERPAIAAFVASRYDRPLRAGQLLHLRLLGSSGARAAVQLPWRGVEVTLEEAEPGVYSADYEIPDGMEIAGTHLTARLRNAAGQTATAQSDAQIVVDTATPRVYNLSPPPDSLIEPTQARIAASYQDRGPAGIDSATVAVRLDGKALTLEPAATASGVQLALDVLQPGRHTASIEVADLAGNTASETWEFTVQAPGARIVGVTHDAAAPLRPGQVITVTATVEAVGRRASFDIGEIVQGVPMQLQPETTTYQGAYTVREGDVVENAPVTVHFTDAGGMIHQATAAAPVTIVRPAPGPAPEPEAEIAFAITSPAQGARTGRRITPAGTGPPGRRVEWAIRYQKVILAGETGRGTATIAEDGTWTAAEEVDLRHPLLGMGDRYTLTAQLLGEGDEVLEELSVTFTASDR